MVAEPGLPGGFRFLGGGIGYFSVEDHYLHTKWNFTG